MRFESLGLIMLYLCSLSDIVDSFFGLASRRKIFENPIIMNWINHGGTIDSLLPLGDHGYVCHLMLLSSKQRRICMRERGYRDVLMESLRLSARACQKEFQYERWNCSLGFTRRNLLRKATKESAVLTAFAAAGMAYAMAKGCSSGQLDRCGCDRKEDRQSLNHQLWTWGGCGDNIRQGGKQTLRFVKLATAKKNTVDDQNIVQHNAKIGISVVKDGSQVICKCHGVSGSCTMKSCWTALPPVKLVTKKLHQLYLTVDPQIHMSSHGFKSDHSDLASTAFNLISTQGSRPTIPASRKKKENLGFYVTTESPDFCTRSKMSYGVSGRRCHVRSPWKTRRRESMGTCDQLCCGHNASIARYEEFSKTCNCSYSAFNVSCRHCRQKEMRYYCK